MIIDLNLLPTKGLFYPNSTIIELDSPTELVANVWRCTNFSNTFLIFLSICTCINLTCRVKVNEEYVSNLCICHSDVWYIMVCLHYMYFKENDFYIHTNELDEFIIKNYDSNNKIIKIDDEFIIRDPSIGMILDFSEWAVHNNEFDEFFITAPYLIKTDQITFDDINDWYYIWNNLTISKKNSIYTAINKLNFGLFNKSITLNLFKK